MESSTGAGATGQLDPKGETGKKTAKPAVKKWYIVHTYSGQEGRAKKALL